MAKAVIGKRIPKYLRQRRERAGLTIRQLAGKAGIPSTSLYQYEAGSSDIVVARLEAIARVYGEDLVTFLSPLAVSAPRRAKALRNFQACGEQP